VTKNITTRERNQILLGFLDEQGQAEAGRPSMSSLVTEFTAERLREEEASRDSTRRLLPSKLPRLITNEDILRGLGI
jgi:hypothetical protein